LVTTREPGGTQIAEEIRKVLLYLDATETMKPTTELLLMFAARAQHVDHLIRPALASGKWVVSDRFVDASFAYQGGGRNIPANYIQELEKMVVGNVMPDLTFLLDVSLEVSSKRTNKRGTAKDRIEQEKDAFFNNVRNAYLDRAKRDPRRIKIIDANQDVLAVNMQIAKHLDAILEDVKT